MSNAKRKTRKRLLIVFLLVCAAGSAGAYFYFHKREVVVTVQTEKAARRNLTELVVANGKIQTVMQVVINPEVSGEITELPVKEGQHVERGDLLVKIKPDNYRASRNSAEASFKSAADAKTLARANLTKAEAEYKRAKELATNQLISD